MRSRVDQARLLRLKRQWISRNEDRGQYLLAFRGRSCLCARHSAVCTERVWKCRPVTCVSVVQMIFKGNQLVTISRTTSVSSISSVSDDQQTSRMR